MIVFGAKLDVCCYNSDFNDCDNIDDANDGQESEYIVVPTLILPYAAKDEEELNEYDSKRHQTG